MRKKMSWGVTNGLVGIVVLLAGCHFSGLRMGQRLDREEQDRPLSDRQVADVQLTLARSLERRGEIESAMSAYQEAIEKNPRRATGYWRLAILQDRQGHFDESEALYRQALKLDSKNPDLCCDYGYSLYLQRRWAESEEQLSRAIALKPRDQRAHNNLGLVLAQTERSNEALAEFRKSGCNTSEAHSNLAFVMTLNKRWDDARCQYELALDADPDSAVAKSGLECLEAVVAKAGRNASSIALVKGERPASNGSLAGVATIDVWETSLELDANDELEVPPLLQHE